MASPPPPSQRQITLTLGLSQLLAWGSSYYLLAVLARPMADSFGLSPVVIYAMFSAALVVAGLLGPVVGARTDRRGGRAVLRVSSIAFALAHLVMATAPHPAWLAFGWLLLGAAMPFGLYDAAFSTAVGLYGEQARRTIVGITLIAGFSSSLSLPISAFMEAQFGWRSACALWAVLHLTLGLFLHSQKLPRGGGRLSEASAGEGEALAPPSAARLWLLAAIFAAGGFVFSAYAAHLPRVLEALGATPMAAIAAASLVGVAQVAGRVLELGAFNRLPGLFSARLATALHPLGALLLLAAGPPLAALFAVLHGAGQGIMTIVKGTLPLQLFGAAGFGKRAGLLEGPSRFAQASAPLLFGLAVEHWGAQVLWLSAGLTAFAFAGVWSLGAGRRPQ